MKKEKVIILNDINFNSGSLFKNIDGEGAFFKENILEEKPKKKRRRKKKSRMYFTPETESFIVLYNSTENFDERNNIYNVNIKPAFDKLAENMINTFSFSYIRQTYIETKSDVVSHMLLNIDKYKQEKGKAFSYFSIMAKHYLIIRNNESYKELKIVRSIDGGTDDDENVKFDIMDESFTRNIQKEELSEFVQLMVNYWDENINLIFKKRRDIEIAYAVIELFRNVKSLEFFNKKALYLLIREMTNHKTQYITKVINKMLDYYPTIKNMYYNSGTIEHNKFF